MPATNNTPLKIAGDYCYRYGRFLYICLPGWLQTWYRKRNHLNHQTELPRVFYFWLLTELSAIFIAVLALGILWWAFRTEPKTLIAWDKNPSALAVGIPQTLSLKLLETDKLEGVKIKFFWPASVAILSAPNGYDFDSNSLAYQNNLPALNFIIRYIGNIQSTDAVVVELENTKREIITRDIYQLLAIDGPIVPKISFPSDSPGLAKLSLINFATFPIDNVKANWTLTDNLNNSSENLQSNLTQDLSELSPGQNFQADWFYQTANSNSTIIIDHRSVNVTVTGTLAGKNLILYQGNPRLNFVLDQASERDNPVAIISPELSVKPHSEITAQVKIKNTSNNDWANLILDLDNNFLGAQWKLIDETIDESITNQPDEIKSSKLSLANSWYSQLKQNSRVQTFNLKQLSAGKTWNLNFKKTLPPNPSLADTLLRQPELGGRVLYDVMGQTQTAEFYRTWPWSPAIKFSPELIYTTADGNQIGRGPWPPIEGESSLVWATISVSNPYGLAKAWQITCQLGPGVEFSTLAAATSALNTDLKLDQSARKFTWSGQSLLPAIGTVLRPALSVGVPLILQANGPRQAGSVIISCNTINPAVIETPSLVL